MPADCERVVSVHGDSASTTEIPYKIESILQADESYVNALVSNSNSVFLRYCRQITDPNLMTASFRQVLILRMAKIFAISIAKSNPLYQALDAEEQRAFRSAKSTDAIEDYPEKRPEGSWAASRRRFWTRDSSGWSAR